MKNAVLIYNLAAGGRSRRREHHVRAAAKVLASQGIDAALVTTKGPGSATGLARQAVEQGAELILACGGDGTLNEVLNGIAPGKTPFAVLPGGTANVFAHELGIPLSPERAATQLANYTQHRIALGRAAWSDASGQPHARYFLCLAGVGFDAHIIHKLEREFATDFGVFAYLWEGMRQVFRYRFPPFTQTLNGRSIEGTFAVVQRTARYAGWLRIAPGASLFENNLTTCLFKSSSRARYFTYAAAMIARTHARLRDVEMQQSQKVEYGAANHHQIFFELDGELAGQLPVTFEIVPDALTLLAP